MDIPPTMDKKNSRNPGQLTKNGQDPSKSTNPECLYKKNGAQNARKREYDKNDNGRRSSSNRGGRPGQRYVRTREKMGGQINDTEEFSEFGSLQRGGGKKQNITHLMNWWNPDRPDRYGRNKPGMHMGRGHKPLQSVKYDKESFLQARCQFVVRSGEDYTAWQDDPDRMVDWSLVEEVRLHVSEEPSCPICLYTPTAAKVTRCGHVFCFPCILHYLALSDDNWRKCPICYDAVSKEDLKSVTSIVQGDSHRGEVIELQLMRRERDSLIPCPVWAYNPEKTLSVATLADPISNLMYSKLVVATNVEVANSIIQREIDGLQCQLAAEGDQPEACFIEEALALVLSRRDLLESVSLSRDKASNVMLGLSAKLIEEDATGKGSKKGSHLGKGIVDPCKQQIPDDPAKFDSDLDLCTGFSSQLQLGEDLSTGTTVDQPRRVSESSDSTDVSESVDSLNSSEQVVKVDDLDISQHQHIKTSVNQSSSPKSVFYFYQAVNGSHVYLHALNVHMLVKQYGSLELCPAKISGMVLEKESAGMTTELRHRLRYLRHLPVTCVFDVVEIELPTGLISSSVVKEYEAQLRTRVQKRRKRLKEEAKVSKRIQREEDRLMGRSRGVDVHLESQQHFPSFREESLPCDDDPALSEATVAGALSTSASDSEWTCSSFAQVISSGKKINSTPAKSIPQAGWPTLGANTATPKPRATTISTSEDDDTEKAPDFNASFSEAFAKALDKVKSTETETPGNRHSGKKKKKKGIVLMSSGGR